MENRANRQWVREGRGGAGAGRGATGHGACRRGLAERGAAGHGACRRGVGIEAQIRYTYRRDAPNR